MTKSSTVEKKKKKSPTSKKKNATKPLKVNQEKKDKEREKKVHKKVKAYRKGKVKTIEDILCDNAKKFSMKGDEVLSNEQMKILLTQIAIGNAEDGLTGLAPSIGERLTAIKQIADMTKNDVDDNAIEEHNESIREFEIRNGIDAVNNAPNRKIEEFE